MRYCTLHSTLGRCTLYYRLLCSQSQCALNHRNIHIQAMKKLCSVVKTTRTCTIACGRKGTCWRLAVLNKTTCDERSYGWYVIRLNKLEYGLCWLQFFMMQSLSSHMKNPEIFETEYRMHCTIVQRTFLLPCRPCEQVQHIDEEMQSGWMKKKFVDYQIFNFWFSVKIDQTQSIGPGMLDFSAW